MAAQLNEDAAQQASLREGAAWPVVEAALMARLGDAAGCCLPRALCAALLDARHGASDEVSACDASVLASVGMLVAEARDALPDEAGAPWSGRRHVSRLVCALRGMRGSGAPPARRHEDVVAPGAAEVLPMDLRDPGSDWARSVLLALAVLLAAVCARGRASECEAEAEALLLAIGRAGVLALLGQRVTVGSLDALCPPLTALLRSFSQPFREPDEAGRSPSRLSAGARALAKHQNRSAGFWPPAGGGEAAKNAAALRALGRILADPAWINQHVVPDGQGGGFAAVLEVRGPALYGARWSADGAAFRGFLEPEGKFPRRPAP